MGERIWDYSAMKRKMRLPLNKVKSNDRCGFIVGTRERVRFPYVSLTHISRFLAFPTAAAFCALSTHTQHPLP